MLVTFCHYDKGQTVQHVPAILLLKAIFFVECRDFLGSDSKLIPFLGHRSYIPFIIQGAACWYEITFLPGADLKNIRISGPLGKTLTLSVAKGLCSAKAHLPSRPRQFYHSH
jgi:hypothetical protein